MSFGVPCDKIGSAVESLAQQVWCLKRGEEGKLQAGQGLSRGLFSLDGMVDKHRVHEMEMFIGDVKI